MVVSERMISMFVQGSMTWYILLHVPGSGQEPLSHESVITRSLITLSPKVTTLQLCFHLSILSRLLARSPSMTHTSKPEVDGTNGTPGLRQGKVYVNGRAQDEHFFLASAYVPQDHVTLTDDE